MAEPKTASEKKVGEPAVFVHANNRTNFESQVELKFTILNVSKIGNSKHLTSPTFYIQSLPFYVVIEHERKKSSGKKGIRIDNFNIHLIVGKGVQDQWSSKFSVNLQSSVVRELQKFFELELTETNHKISHTIEWETVSERKNLYFRMDISAERPNGDYEWPSYKATGYNGIVNEGATCYINCLLQSLYFTNEFRRLVYGIPIESEDINESFLFWLKYIFFTLQFNGLPNVTTKKMIKCFNWNEMNETNQQDVQEFLRLLMDKIEQFVDGTEFKQRLTDLFVGSMKTTITCKNANYSTSKNESFWDIQLPIDESPNVFGAFGEFLETITIDDFKYGDEAGAKDEAEQEFEITKWPPVLHIHLKRFCYDVKTNSLTKNNKRFEFYPQLDLSHYGDDAIYTLHSVLVHSGSLNSGHYMAYICPKADNQWFKFNDEVVTKCSAADEAIQENYGDDYRSTNAYMLVYIKTSCVQEILQDIPEAEINDKALIEHEITKEIEELANQHKFFEVIVFTSDTLHNNVKLKKGQYIFDTNHGQSFYIEKEKSLADLYNFLLKELRSESLVLWLLNIKKEGIRMCDMPAFFDKPLNKVCNKDQVHFYVETPSLEYPWKDSFQKNKHTLVLIKEYDSMTKRLIFHMHQYFMLTQTVADLQTFIKKAIVYDGSTKNIAIIVEKGSGEEYSCRECEPAQSIGRITTKFSDTHSAIVVFEVVENGRRPKYIQFTGAQSSSKSKQPPANKEIANGIDVSVKNDDNGEEYLALKFSPSDQLLCIVQRLSTIQSCSPDDIQLLDTERNIIDTQFLDCSIEKYLEARNSNCRTRGQKQKNLVFTFKMVQSNFSQPMDTDNNDDFMNGSSMGVPVKCSTPQKYISMDLEANDTASVYMAKEALESPPKVQEPDMFDEVEMLNVDEPSALYSIPVKFMEADAKQVFMIKRYPKSETMDRIVAEFVRHHNLNINHLVFTDEKDGLLSIDQRPLELYLDCDQTEMVIYFKVEEQMKKRTMKRTKSKDQFTTDDHQREAKQLYLTFKDQTAKRDPMDIEFKSTDKFSLAIERIADVMELDRSKTHFFDANDAEVTNFRGTVSHYLKSHSITIEYKVVDRSTFDVLEVNRTGNAVGVKSISISKSTTVGDICDACGSTKYAQVVRMKDGLIHGIVARNTKVIRLIDDGHTYRMDNYSTSIFDITDKNAFHVCVKFIGDASAGRQRTPLLVKIKNGQPLQVIGLRLFNLFTMSNMSVVNDFQYSIDGKFVNKDQKIEEPKDPKSIPVVLLNMNQRKPNYSYRNTFKR